MPINSVYVHIHNFMHACMHTIRDRYTEHRTAYAHTSTAS